MLLELENLDEFRGELDMNNGAYQQLSNENNGGNNTQLAVQEFKLDDVTFQSLKQKSVALANEHAGDNDLYIHLQFLLASFTANTTGGFLWDPMRSTGYFVLDSVITSISGNMVFLLTGEGIHQLQYKAIIKTQEEFNKGREAEQKVDFSAIAENPDLNKQFSGIIPTSRKEICIELHGKIHLAGFLAFGAMPAIATAANKYVVENLKSTCGSVGSVIIAAPLVGAAVATIFSVGTSQQKNPLPLKAKIGFACGMAGSFGMRHFGEWLVEGANLDMGTRSAVVAYFAGLGAMTGSILGSVVLPKMARNTVRGCTRVAGWCGSVKEWCANPSSWFKSKSAPLAVDDTSLKQPLAPDNSSSVNAPALV